MMNRMAGRVARRRRSISAALAAAVLALATPGSARAQGKAPAGEIEMEPAPEPAAPAASEPVAPAEAKRAKDPRAARTQLLAGQRLMQKGAYFAARKRPDQARAQFESAALAFQKALDASDEPEARFELAGADDKLGKLDEAVKQLRIVVAAPGLRPEVAKQAAAKLLELSAKVGVVTLTVAPDGASITLGGIELGTAPLRAPLVLMPGTYTLAFVAEGFEPKDAEITVEPGTETTHAVELEAIKIVVEPVRPLVVATVVPEAPPPPRSKVPLVVGGGITVVAIAGATVAGVLALRRHDTFAGAMTSAIDRQDARDAGTRLARVSDVAIGTAVVAAGFTTGWYFFKYRQRPEKPEVRRSPAGNAKLDVVPWVQPQSGGVTIAGWF
jgi:PEGA domain